MSNDRSDADQLSARTLTALVGVGSSAGGLEAMERMFAAIPPDLGAAFVIVQHLDADAAVVQSDTIAWISPYPVEMLSCAAMVPEANRVYVISPPSDLHCDGHLWVEKVADLRRRAALIDRVFQTMAGERHCCSDDGSKTLAFRRNL